MDKEKILSKSRNQEDEGVQFVNAKGHKAGVAFFNIIFIILITFATFFAKTNQANTIQALIALYSTFWAGESYAKYKFFANKSHLTATFISVLAVVLSSMAYIVSILR